MCPPLYDNKTIIKEYVFRCSETIVSILVIMFTNSFIRVNNFKYIMIGQERSVSNILVFNAEGFNNSSSDREFRLLNTTYLE